MKLQIALLAVLIFAGAVPGGAQPSADAAAASYFSSDARYHAACPARLETSYLHALQSPNDGVVHSGLAHVIRMKLALPDRSFPRIEEALRTLAVSGRTPALRHKAYLASVVFDGAEVLLASECRSCATPEALFAAVAARVQETAISLR